MGKIGPEGQRGERQKKDSYVERREKEEGEGRR